VTLTKREHEVLHWIVDGSSNGQIATILGISSNTVAVHRANIMKKMGVHKTAELVVYAIRHSLASVSLPKDTELTVQSVQSTRGTSIAVSAITMHGSAGEAR
jgi:DNA-binding CsgD family transcriptional regulator